MSVLDTLSKGGIPALKDAAYMHWGQGWLQPAPTDGLVTQAISFIPEPQFPQIEAVPVVAVVSRGAAKVRWARCVGAFVPMHVSVSWK